jgi:hypothetical protein
MTQETRSTIAEQARVYALLGFLGAVIGWAGFAQQLHTELTGEVGFGEFDWPLVLWLLCGVLSTVMVTASLAVAWIHRYFAAASAPAPGDPSGA